jgi:PPOX class probable F420-dependent enzyme
LGDNPWVNDATMRQRFSDARVGRLATVTAQRRPHVVPCCFALDQEVVYSVVDAKPKSTLALRRLDNLRAHPFAALLVDHYDDDWAALWWVRVDGGGRVVEGGNERDGALALLTAKYEQYRRDPPPGPVVAVDVVQWRGWP